jgi:hypothetical protein
MLEPDKHGGAGTVLLNSAKEMPRMTDIDGTSQTNMPSATRLMYREFIYIAQVQHNIVPGALGEWFRGQE